MVLIEELTAAALRQCRVAGVLTDLSPQSWPGGLGSQGGFPSLQQVLELLLMHCYCSCPVCSCLRAAKDGISTYVENGSIVSVGTIAPHLFRHRLIRTETASIGHCRWPFSAVSPLFCNCCMAHPSHVACKQFTDETVFVPVETELRILKGRIAITLTCCYLLLFRLQQHLPTVDMKLHASRT